MARRTPVGPTLPGLATPGRQVTLRLPELYALRVSTSIGRLQQLAIPERTVSGELIGLSGKDDTECTFRAEGREILIVTKPTNRQSAPDDVLLCKGGALSTLGGTGSSHSLFRLRPRHNSSLETPKDAGSRCQRVLATWENAFTFNEQRRLESGTEVPGLRPPQIGAIHAALGHWRANDAPGTVVMPTGTGKTETMLALFAKERPTRLLVVVPTSALRAQLSHKFLNMGLLKRMGVLAEEAELPVVGTLSSRPTTAKETLSFFRRCNVVVTTMAIAGGCKPEVQAAMASESEWLFIDEAHHIGAPTWAAFRQAFAKQRILQFTATPFREDGQLVEGRTIFNFPLRKAQEQGYFSPITFRPVTEFTRTDSDSAIAEVAIAQLEADLAQGHDHIVMARCASVARAIELHELYRKLSPNHSATVLYSSLSTVDQREALAAINSRRSRIIVCVDMLGEGYDFPNLKIAALHDIHKSLAITLQFTGRFTRRIPHLGSATIIANVGDVEVESALQDLYSEDPDWNLILRRLSEGATDAQVERTDFLDSFGIAAGQIPLQNVLPKMSAVIYSTTSTTWQPSKLAAAIGNKNLLCAPMISQKARVAVAVTKQSDAVRWGNIKDLRNVVHDLVLVYWNEKKKLLFINTSNNSFGHERLAKAICGDSASLVRGEQVFRVFGGVVRLVLMNLGLGHAIGRAISFTMYVGADVLEGLASATLRTKYKSNLFARGYERGGKASYGCSHRGRLWSHKAARDITDWQRWCDGVGEKLQDSSIDVNQIILGALRFTPVASRPSGYPISMEWPEELLARPEDAVTFEYGGASVDLSDVSLEVSDASESGPLRFVLVAPGWRAPYELAFGADGVKYVPLSALGATVRFGDGDARPIGDWFSVDAPTTRFADGSFLIANQYCRGPENIPPYDVAKISVWTWKNTDIQCESQTSKKLTQSIQFRLLQEMRGAAWPTAYDIIFDDDDAYEAADVVGIKINPDKVEIHLFHCKYSHGTVPGGRISDLYEVCGQAQKCIRWRDDPVKLFDHLKAREVKALANGRGSRFEVGTLQLLHEIRRRSRHVAPDFGIFIVQPGLSKAGVSPEQMHLLASTQLYLKETYEIDLRVIASA